jgi:hypothetical protein
MSAKNHPLQILEDDLEYFQSLLSTQLDSSRLNALSIPIEDRIEIILNWLRKNRGSSIKKEIDFAFVLLRKYIILWQLYFKNHPGNPQTRNNLS